MARVGAVQKSSNHRLETERLVKFLRAQVMGGGVPPELKRWAKRIAKPVPGSDTNFQFTESNL